MNHDEQCLYEEVHLGSHAPHTDEDEEYDEQVMEDDIDQEDPDLAPLSQEDDGDHSSSPRSEEDDSQSLSPGFKYIAVVEGLHAGKSYAAIARETGIPKSTVGSIKRRWSSKGNIDDGRKHNGRPPKLTPKQMQLIESTLSESQVTLSSTDLLRILKFDVSARTIRRAKRAIIEKRCQDRRNSVILAARSLAAASHVSGHDSGLMNPFLIQFQRPQHHDGSIEEGSSIRVL